MQISYLLATNSHYTSIIRLITPQNNNPANLALKSPSRMKESSTSNLLSTFVVQTHAEPASKQFQSIKLLVYYSR